MPGMSSYVVLAGGRLTKAECGIPAVRVERGACFLKRKTAEKAKTPVCWAICPVCCTAV